MDLSTYYDKDRYKALKKEYDKAVAENKEVFLFNDQELYTAYAKYLLEYLESQLF
jgi:hypothetical protein